MLKRKSKRVLSIVLAIAMIIGLFPIAAFAEEGGETTTPVDQNTETVATALPDADANGVITLTQDVDISTSGYTVSGNITIDLAGYDLKVANTEKGGILIPSGESLTLRDTSAEGDGRIYTETDYTGSSTGYGIIYVSGGTFNMENGSIYAVRDDASSKGQFAAFVGAGGTVNINGGKIEAGWYALAGNGTDRDLQSTININGGTLVSTADYALYLPHNCVTTINDGTVTGAAGGIAQRAGKLIINGGTIASQGTGDTGDWSDGTSGMGKAAVNIGDSGKGLYNNVSVEIKGGNFTAANEALSVNVGSNTSGYSANVAITGGTYADDVSKYVPTGYECVKDDQTYKVQTASNLEADATVSGNSADATVGGNFSGQEDATEDNVATENGTLTIDATAENASNVTESNVTIAPEALTSVNNATSVQNVAIKTDVATVTVDNAAWNAMTTNAGTESVTLSVEKKTAADSAPLTYTLTATNASGDDVYSASNAAGAITISVPYSNGSNPKVFYVGSKGLEDMNASLTNGILSWIARHFSDYVVLDDSVIATITTSDGNVSSYTDAATFATAVGNAADGSVVELMKDITLDATGKANTQGILTITNDITINGNGKTITAKNVSGTPSMINVENGANVTINNLILDGAVGGKAAVKHGVNIYQATATLNDVTVKNHTGYASVVNGSNLKVNGLTTDNNGWGGVNVDNKSGNANLTVNDAVITENSSIVFDKTGDNPDATTISAAIKGGEFVNVVMGKDKNDSPIDGIDSLIVTGGKFNTEKLVSGAINIVDFVPEGYVYDPTTGTVSVYKEPEYTGKYSYEIFTKVGENGTISVDRYATEGDDVTITVSPDEAYLLDELTVTTGGKEVEVKDNGNGTYTFKMPSADAKIVVTFAEDPDWEPAPEMPFTDVNDNDWFYDVVLYAYDNGLMTGVSATEFAPNQTTTRGMIVSMLARLEGVTSAEDAGFADVAANDWYATAVNWAASVGVVNGYEDNTFRPNAPITREQMAAILYNYADYKGYDVSARADLSDYADAADVSSWAEDVLSWANAEGLINGMTATTIDPQGATTRAQTAAMFERFLTAHEA